MRCRLRSFQSQSTKNEAVWVGLRTAFTHTPWQGYSIAALGTFIGVMAEGFVIDTDHWRHFFLLVGIIWGLAAATAKSTRPA